MYCLPQKGKKGKNKRGVVQKGPVEYFCLKLPNRENRSNVKFEMSGYSNTTIQPFLEPSDQTQFRNYTFVRDLSHWTLIKMHHFLARPLDPIQYSHNCHLLWHDFIKNKKVLFIHIAEYKGGNWDGNSNEINFNRIVHSHFT